MAYVLNNPTLIFFRQHTISHISLSSSAACASTVRVGQLLGLVARYMYNCFRTWLYEDRTKTPTGHEIGQSPDMISQTESPSIDDRWRDIAKLCLRFVTIGTSDANCERSLSRQRQVQGLNTSNITTELLEARMRTLTPSVWRLILQVH